MRKNRIVRIQRALFVVFAVCAAAALSPRASAQGSSEIYVSGSEAFSNSCLEVDTEDYEAAAGVMAEILDPNGNVIASGSNFDGGSDVCVPLGAEAALAGWYSVYATYWEYGVNDIDEGGEWTYLGDETEWAYSGGRRAGNHLA